MPTPATGPPGTTPADPTTPGATPTSAADVPLLHHPGDDARRRHLAALGLPRVLVVAEGADPPVSDDPIEDWARAPLDDEEVGERRRVVLDRFRRATGGVLVDRDGLLRVGSRWAPLSDLQRATLFPLLNQPGRPVARAVLLAEYLAAGGHHERGLLALLNRVRPRLQALGMTLHVLRNGGVLVIPPDAEGGQRFINAMPRGNIVETTT